MLPTPSVPRRSFPRWTLGFGIWSFSGAVLAALLLPACDENHYVVELRPDGPTLRRSLTCWREEDHWDQDKPKRVEIPADIVRRLNAIYPEMSRVPDAKPDSVTLRFTGVFTGATPDDVGGKGSFHHLVTSLGTLSAYVERFRGDDDLAAETARRHEAADRLTDLVIGWLRAELGADARFEKLRAFCDADLRRDLRNLATYAWLVDNTPGAQPEWGVECLVRFAQYLAERGYFRPEDIPGIVRDAMLADARDDSGPLLARLRTLIETRLGPAEPGAKTSGWDFLSTRKAWEASWSAYLGGTEAYRELRAAWEEKRKTDPAAREPTPWDVLDNRFKQVMELDLFPSHDQLKVALACPVKPFGGNGTWDEKAGTMRWEFSLVTRPRIPSFCFASWSVPDAAEQTRRFGKVVLDGQRLAEYCAWRQGLDATDAREWDAFLSGLSPGPDLAEKLKAFRFTRDPGAEKGLATSILKSLHGALSPDGESRR